MHLLITGGTGFIGTALCRALLARGDRVTVLTRDARHARSRLPAPVAAVEALAGLAAVDGVVNLAGENLGAHRWTEARKRAILESRLAATRSLVAAIARVEKPPAVFVSASAVGYYGARGDELITEATSPGNDFLAHVCVQWEREAEQAASVTRVAIVRTGMALHPEGGALAKMLVPFRLALGGPLGSGTQWVPWIHRHDWVDLVRWMMSEPNARGAFNGVAPEPVHNAEFARALGRALRRPAVMPVPAIALRMLFGELAEILLTGQRAIPARAIEMGFRFRFQRLEDALAHLFR
jgi:uncharacterized protein (TIGR01777 family)